MRIVVGSAQLFLFFEGKLTSRVVEVASVGLNGILVLNVFDIDEKVIQRGPSRCTLIITHLQQQSRRGSKVRERVQAAAEEERISKEAPTSI